MRTAVVSCILALSLSALARPPAAPPTPRLPKNALRVPIVPQSTSWSCGAGSLLGVLYYWKAYDGPERDLHHPLGTTAANGTHPTKIVQVARSYGLEARFRERLKVSDLRRALRHGITPIVDLQAWREDEKVPWEQRWEDGHYVVLVGLDRHYAYFMDPSAHGGYGFMPLSDLMKRWHDYESSSGKIRRYHRSAIFIRGSTPLRRNTLIPIE